MIPKKAQAFPEHLQHTAVFSSARAGLSAFYAAQAVAGRLRIILPSYIGWSPNEGSGLFDSVADGEFDYAFYAIDRQGNASVESLEALEETSTPSVLVLVHYFGRPDPSYDELVEVGKNRGWFLVDDCAHGMLTHMCARRLGTKSDAMVYSLHKMPPLSDGGILLTTSGGISDGVDPDTALRSARAFIGYDHGSAASRRQQVSIAIHERISILDGLASPLWDKVDLTTFIPQSYPILVHAGSEMRDTLYERLNQMCGLTTLYHTLIDPLRADDRFADSVWLSNHITNLPVHSEVSLDSVESTLFAIRNVLTG